MGDDAASKMKTGSMGGNAKEVGEVRTDSVKGKGSADPSAAKTTVERTEGQSVPVGGPTTATSADADQEGVE